MTAIAHKNNTVNHAMAMSANGSPRANLKLIPLLIIEVRALVICRNGQIKTSCNKLPATAPDLVRSDTIRCKAEAATLKSMSTNANSQSQGKTSEFMVELISPAITYQDR